MGQHGNELGRATDASGRDDAKYLASTEMRYTSPKAAGTTPALKGPQGQLATTLDEKETLIEEAAFPTAPEGTATSYISSKIMHEQATEKMLKQPSLAKRLRKRYVSIN